MQGRQLGLPAAVGLTLALIVGLRVWFSEGAAERRLQMAPLGALERQVAAGQADFRAARVLGERLAEAGRYEEAEPLFRKLIGADGEHWLAYVGLGRVLMATGRQSEAFQVLKIPVSRRPGLVEARLALAELYLARQAYAAAIPELKAVLERDPERAETWYNLSQCHDALAQPSRARQALEQAMRYAPREDRYPVELARSLRKAGDPEGARQHLDRALALNPHSPTARYTLGEILAARPGAADAEAAAAEFRAVLRLAPGYPPAHYQLGLLAMRGREWAAAAGEFEQALKSAPAFSEAIFNLARAYDRLGRAAEARRLRARFARLTELEQQILDLRTRIGFGREDRETYLRLARAYQAAGQPDRAHETLVAARQRYPRDAEIRAALGKLGALSGQPVAR